MKKIHYLIMGAIFILSLTFIMLFTMMFFANLIYDLFKFVLPDLSEIFTIITKIIKEVVFKW